MSKLRIEQPFFRKLFKLQVVGTIVGLGISWAMYKLLDDEVLD